ncbi:hypothetical protein E8E11_006789 [Didymella keratinophila]|nr:hypothetical protein E8E11_006789 [Didymella keratinophila]
MSTKHRDDLPSWVPDWTSTGSPIADIRASAFTTCYNTTKIPHLYDLEFKDRPVLLVKGMEVARVIRTGDVIWDEADDVIKDTLTSWHELQRGSVLPPIKAIDASTFDASPFS